MPAGGSLHPSSHETVDRRLHYVKQDGATVFKFAVRKTEEIARRLAPPTQRAGAQDRKYVHELSRFIKDWEPKSETRELSEFLEYLDFFQQANGTVSLDDETPGDAVRLDHRAVPQRAL